MNIHTGNDSPTPSPQSLLRAFAVAAAAEVEADERYKALSRLVPSDRSPLVAGILEGRHSRLLEARARAEAQATEVLRVLGVGGLLGAWLASIGEDD